MCQTKPKPIGRSQEGPGRWFLRDLERPITDNTGKVVVEKDKAADDEFLGGVKFYVKGVEGKVPGGDKK